ncbi:isoprenylcysteine carboxylmethyltransferase family protein [Rhodopirellula sp. JC740]|uniref:Isoprenylcysteine carboxylmethyltransferase family protein n=1 Tax=Rhodopirellula halodulae TaxID=2894198 RepID=A0ABS8NH67_9BACT|nr:isoprenylcysteine carboxylmethyltransferase family protein [Rhodopirellula sp. JC740]MCC9642901.1 isoprenylcysteine carboxylmethyltransferase family protein [Rhodopirellula sp. JC740]
MESPTTISRQQNATVSDGEWARRIVAGYLVVQAASTLLWWGMLILFPASIRWFWPERWPVESLWVFGLADGGLIVAGSALAALLVMRQSAWASIAVWSVAATVWYPTLVCVAVSAWTGEAWVGSSLMISMAGLSLAMATIHGRDGQPATIRTTCMLPRRAIVCTLAQTAIFWSTFLWVLPMGLLEWQLAMGVIRFQHPLQEPVAIGGFLVASALGLWSGISMSVRGQGTPLPTATASKLVVEGPYRLVRNPMAVAGIGQGIAVGWYLGSWFVIAYAFTGAVVWHLLVRPVEERDLKLRFGEDYLRYQNEVALWVPRWPGAHLASRTTLMRLPCPSQISVDAVDRFKPESPSAPQEWR